MNDPQRPLPLSAVLEIVERRRRRRSKAQTLAGSALGVAAAGIAGLIVVTLRSEPAVPVAGPRPPAVSSAAAPPPFDPAYLSGDYLTGLADSILTGGTDPQHVRQVHDAYALSEAWGLELYPAAKAVAAKAALTGTVIDPRNPEGDDELVSRFEEAGYTDDYAADLAEAWMTDSRTAKIVGALVIDAESPR